MTTLLAELLERDELDGAVVARESEDDPLRGVPFLATSHEELLEAAGSSYTQTMGLGGLDDLLEASELDPAEADLALVGTPCMIQGATALDRYDHESADPISLTIALLCTRSFEYSRLQSSLGGHGLDSEEIDRLDISEGILYAFGADGETLLEADIDAFDAAGLRGCDECADFVGAAADLSVGNVHRRWNDHGDRPYRERASEALEAAAINRSETLERTLRH